MERVAGIEPAHRPWQGCRLPLHHTRLQIWWTVRESNSSLKLAKLPCYHYHQQPISIKILHQYIVYVKSKNQPYPIWIRFVRVRHTGVYRVPHAVGVNPQHAYCFISDTLAVLWAYLTHRLLAEHSRWLLFRT